MVKKNLFQYGDSQLHNLQLKTARHLVTDAEKRMSHSAGKNCELQPGILFLFFDVVCTTSCRLDGLRL